MSSINIEMIINITGTKAIEHTFHVDKSAWQEMIDLEKEEHCYEELMGMLQYSWVEKTNDN